jgi:hypothetical protein
MYTCCSAIGSMTFRNRLGQVLGNAVIVEVRTRPNLSDFRTGLNQLTELIRQCRFFRILRSDGAHGRRQPWPGADSCHS